MSRSKKPWKELSTNDQINRIGFVLTAIAVIIAILSFVLSDLRMGDRIFPNPTVESSPPTSPSQIPSPTLHPTPTLASTVTPLPIDTKSPDQTLILIFTIYRGENLIDTAIQDEIKNGIESQILALKLSNVRVEIEPMIIKYADREQVERLADQYDATHVIWGQDTGTRVLVNFWNREQPQYQVSDVMISETERTQIGDPASYNEFVVEDLPRQLTFLSLFALAQAYYSDKANPNLLEATRLLEQALEALPSDTELNIGSHQVAAYFRLGWLYQRTGDLDKAQGYYRKALELYPEYSEAHNNLGLLFFQKGEHERAMFEYDVAIQLNPNNERAYNNRAIARYKIGDQSGAIADYNSSIDLRPTPRTHLNRGLVHQFMHDYEAALSDYNRAIEIDPNYALAYYRRGRALYLYYSDCMSAIADYQKYLELHPDSNDKKVVESEIAFLTDRKVNGHCQ